jgi:large subunit ribosomal protein L4
MVQVAVRNREGQAVETIEVSDYIFAAPINEAAVHQVLVGQLANRRVGTASTKTRGEVAGSTRKLYPQKHTGRARAGSIKSPLRRGGGIIFGPKPRDYRQATPKKMRRLALRSVLTSKVQEGQMVVVDSLSFESPKTKEMVRILGVLGVGRSALVVTSQPEDNLIKSARNIPGIDTMPAPLLNVADLLSHRVLLMTVEAVRQVEELWGPKVPAPQTA